MKVLVYGAGVIGMLLAVRLHESGHDVALLARGERVATLREEGILLAEVGSSDIRSVAVPIVDRPADGYDLTVVTVRAHQVASVLEALEGLDGDVLFLVNWAAGPEPLIAALGGRVLLGFPALGGTMEGEVVRYRAPSPLTRLVRLPISEPDGVLSSRVERLGQGLAATPRVIQQAANGLIAETSTVTVRASSMYPRPMVSRYAGMGGTPTIAIGRLTWSG